MTRLFRNREVCITLALILAAAVCGAFFTGGSLPVYFAVCMAIAAIYIVSEYIHYRKLNRLTAEIDSILHGSDKALSECTSEGDISLLRSEIYKMTVRLRENKHNLLAEKSFLADSLADISHQLRTPLTSVNILLTILSRSDTSAERRRELLMELQEIISRTDWLITTLLKLSKLDAGAISLRSDSLLLKDVIANACMPLEIVMELRGQELKVKADGGFTGDMVWTCEAVSNIVKNCSEHTPEGGCISITASENTLYSDIVIQDNGSGIDPEDLPHIFERFYNGKNHSDKSFGIGLALARRIITEQNGIVKADNAPGGGAVFTLRFFKSTV
ncbi:MAG: HAMP domain-containing histidine kinase [Ruminococcus sp.]|nr:HAMP domain-containing histidine kinase [Ruminococcus sp.]